MWDLLPVSLRRIFLINENLLQLKLKTRLKASEINNMADYDIKEFQKIELEILFEVDRVCKKYNIRYFLLAGTLLGAIRHKGFIPWDDDIDIAMPIDEYRRFCKVASKELGSLYFLQNYQTDFSDRWFSKVRKNNTTCIEKGYEKSNIHQGIWIDVFPVIGVNDNEKNLKKITKIATFAKKMLNKRYAASTTSYRDLSKEKKILRFIPIPVIRSLATTIYSFIFHGTKKFNYCYYLWGDSKIRARFKADLFDELCEVEFEGHMFPAPKDWDKYLTIEYGDYMTPPPPEKRNGGSHTIAIVDVNNDYTKYINR